MAESWGAKGLRKFNTGLKKSMKSQAAKKAAYATPGAMRFASGEGQWRTINGHAVFIKGGTSSGSGTSPKSGMKSGVPAAHKPSGFSKALAAVRPDIVQKGSEFRRIQRNYKEGMKTQSKSYLKKHGLY